MSQLIPVLVCLLCAAFSIQRLSVVMAFVNVLTSVTITTLYMVKPSLFSVNVYASYGTAVINAIYMFALGYILVVTRNKS